MFGQIIGFKETDDDRFLIELKGVIRFNVIREVGPRKIS